MAAEPLTADRNTKSKWLERYISLRLGADTVIYQGALVAVDTNGYAFPAEDANGWVVIGCANETVSNSGGAAGDQRIKVQKGVFGYDNAGDVTVAQTGRAVYVYDDHTVCTTPEKWGVVAGIVDDYNDHDQVFIYFDTGWSWYYWQGRQL